MPTNQQRRETAKRKLERQLERRAKRAEQKRVLMIVAAVVAVLVVIGGAVALIVKPWAKTNTPVSSATTGVPTQDPPATGKLPAFVAPAGLGGNCQYQPTPAEPASKKVNPPRAGTVPTDPAQVSMSMSTNQGNLGLMLDNAKAPCTVNSFVSLAQQSFFNDTPCHRLTAGGVAVLQCGDPSGTGTGGPGYRFANEYPTDQYRPGSPLLDQPVIYPRGTLAMANAGPGTNGSQFFLVYADSQLPPGYTVFGTIDPTGLATLDKIAKGGIKDGGPDGAPATPVTIKSILLD